MLAAPTPHLPQTEIVVVEDKFEDRQSIIGALNTYVDPAHIAEFAHQTEADRFFAALNAPDNPPAARHNLKLVILDFHIDGHDSLPMLERLRSGHVTRHIPVVIFSDSNEHNNVVRCYERGANAFVTKPVDYEAFDETVQAIAEFWLDTHRTGGSAGAEA